MAPKRPATSPGTGGSPSEPTRRRFRHGHYSMISDGVRDASPLRHNILSKEEQEREDLELARVLAAEEEYNYIRLNRDRIDNTLGPEDIQRILGSDNEDDDPNNRVVITTRARSTQRSQTLSDLEFIGALFPERSSESSESSDSEEPSTVEANPSPEEAAEEPEDEEQEENDDDNGGFGEFDAMLREREPFFVRYPLLPASVPVSSSSSNYGDIDSDDDRQRIETDSDVSEDGNYSDVSVGYSDEDEDNEEVRPQQAAMCEPDPNAIQCDKWGQCTICFEDAPYDPVGCLYCMQMIGCRHCINRWFYIPRRSNSPLSDGISSLNHRTCPLCRNEFAHGPEVASMFDLDN